MKPHSLVSSFALFFLLVAVPAGPAAGADLFGKILKQGSDLMGGATGGGTGASALSLGEVAGGLKEALRVGTERVVQNVGVRDGYNGDPAIYIPLPKSLQQAQKALRMVGMSGLADDLELRLNRAAEQAAPKTKALFWKAVEAITFDDAQRIYNGPDDAATQYFRKVASADLRRVIRPVVKNALNQAGALVAYDTMIGEYKNLPLVPDVKANLTKFTTNRAIKGLFHYLAQEEAAIRQNPVKRTTALLQKVFGAN